MDKIKTVTNKPVTRIINTHTHGDHTGNNDFFGASVEVVAHENTKANMERMKPFQGEKAQFLPKKVYKDKLTLGSGKDQIDLFYFGAGTHQRRHVGGLPGAADSADRRHGRVERCAALRP